MTMQDYLADSTQTALDQLIAAYLELPEDKRDWKPSEEARAALDLMIEIALLNAYSTKVIKDRKWDFEATKAYMGEKEKATALSWDELHTLLKENTKETVETIRATPDDVLWQEMDTDFGKMTVKDVMSYPYWNMSYHLGQVNYIDSLVKKES